MNEIDKKTLDAEDNEQGENSGLASYVAPLAIKTLIACLVLFSLVFTLVGCFSPRAFMNMYHAFGDDDMATYYAAAAVERTGDKHKEDCDGKCGFSSLLTTAMSCAANTEGDKYADKALTFTERYLALPCHEMHSAIVDNKYLQGNDMTKTGLTVLSAIYGYDDYVHGFRIKALCSVDHGKADAMLAEDIKNATAENTSLLSELIAYTDFGDYTALNGDMRAMVYDYFGKVSEAVLSEEGSYEYAKPDKRKAAGIASGLSRLSDLAYNLNIMEKSTGVSDGKFTDELVQNMYDFYTGFIELAQVDKPDRTPVTP